MSLAMPTQREAIRGRGWYRSKERWRVPIGPPYVLFLYQHSFAQHLDCTFEWGLRTPNLGDGEAVCGRRW